MTPEELRELAESAGINNITNFTGQMLVGTFQAVFRAGGFKSYQLTVIIVNAVMKTILGRGLSFAGNAALTRTMAVISGPIGWVFTGVWAAIDIAGEAYRVTIPAVILIAALRQKVLYSEASKNIEFS